MKKLEAESLTSAHLLYLFMEEPLPRDLLGNEIGTVQRLSIDTSA